jgi:acetolactate synthase-1/2/3 large subunit
MLLTGAEIVTKELVAHGVDTVFGYPGGSVLNIYDELYKYSDKIRHYLTCHEQGACHAADGYARVTGRPGVVIATSGPGATNLVTGIANAYLDSTPLVAITGNVATSMLGRDSFQEVDITGVTMPITKHNYLVKDVSKLAETLREAFAIAQSGRPGPVLVDIPKDVQTAKTEYVESAPGGACPQDEICPEAVRRAVELISAAKRPYIYCGGGVIKADAAEELLAFADKIDAPVGLSIMGLTAVPYEHPRFLGMVGMHGRFGATKALYESDLVVAVGVRFSDRATGNKAEFMQGRRFLHIDIDAAEIGKNIGATDCILGDVKAALKKLCEALSPQSHPEWNAHIKFLKEHPDNGIHMDSARLTPQSAIEGVCRRHGDGVVATDVGQHQMWTTQFYQFRKPRTFVTSGGLGTMGFGMGAAIGSCIGKDFERTVLITSDGSFHMNLNELATAVSHRLPLVVILLNNQVLGMVRQWQTLFFGSRYSNTTPGRKTDYVRLAEAFGAKGLRATTNEEYEKALDEAFSTDGPVVIDCIIDRDERVLPMIPPGGSISDIILR